MNKTIPQILEYNFQNDPNGFWLYSPETGKAVTWSDVYNSVSIISNELVNLNLKQGSTIAMASHNCVGACLTFLGIVCAGFKATPLNLVAGYRSLRYVVEHSETEFILVEKSSLELVKKAIQPLKSDIRVILLNPESGPNWPNTYRSNSLSSYHYPKFDDIALLMYTSGTTGNPKGVLLSHSNLIFAGGNVVLSHGLKKTDIGLCVLPIYHINGLCCSVMGSLVSGSSLVVPYRFSTRDFWSHLNKFSCSWFSAVPTLFSYLLNDTTQPEIDRSRIRFARSASAPLSPEIHRKFENRFGIPIIETMGLTETGAQILSNPMPPNSPKIGSPGIPVGNEVIISDYSEVPFMPNRVGEILVRGQNVMIGYFKQAEETSKTISVNGWLKTGDLGYADEEGFIFVTGRIKEIIVKGGENIAPREVDEALLAHEGVLEAAAFGVPSKHYGQSVEACVILKKDCTVSPKELQRHCKHNIGIFKTPDSIHILSSLPKGPSGKIQRMKLFDLVYN